MAVSEVNDRTFTSEVLESTKPVLVDFWAPWCMPCRELSPVLEELAQSLSDKLSFCKINVDENPQSHGEWGVRALPTIILFKDGKPLHSKIGVMSRAQLEDWVSSSLVET